MSARSAAFAFAFALLAWPQAAPAGPAAPLDPADAAALAQSYYALPSALPTFHVEPMRGGPPGEYEVRWQTLIRTGYERNDEAKAVLFLPRAAGKRPAILVLHSWRTRDAHAETYLSRGLAQHGFAVMLLELPYHLDRTPAGSESGDLMLSGDIRHVVLSWRQAIIDARTALVFLASRPEIEASRIGLVGVSLGAVLAAVCLGVEPGFRCGVLILGGGDLPLMLRQSFILRGMRRRLSKVEKLQPLEESLRPLDPVTFAAAARGKPILMINGSHDLAMPLACTETLWQALGHPRIRWLPTGHYGPGLIRRQISDLSAHFFSVAFGETMEPLPQIAAPGIKFGLFLDSRGALRPALGLELGHFDHRAWADISLRSEGLSVDVLRELEPALVAGLSLRREDGITRLIPVIGFQAAL